MKKKVFTCEGLARKFAKEVNGTFRYGCLPGYMYSKAIYIVEWREHKDETCKRNNRS